jgi:hypothetical protein
MSSVDEQRDHVADVPSELWLKVFAFIGDGASDCVSRNKCLFTLLFVNRVFKVQFLFSLVLSPLDRFAACAQRIAEQVLLDGRTDLIRAALPLPSPVGGVCVWHGGRLICAKFSCHHSVR